MAKASDIIKTMQSWIGKSRSAGTHHDIIDLYNSYTPRARNYKVTYSDSFCDATVSAAFIKHNAVDLIGGPECGVNEHIKLFQKKGIWIEDGTVVPEPGWIVTFAWKKATQPNDAFGDHIGIVEKVEGNTITTIEGNMSGGVVGRRKMPVGYGYIRGYAEPAYELARPKFSPDLPVTRAQAVTFLWRLCGSEIVSEEHTFQDVPAGVYCYNAVQWAYKNGYVSGKSSKIFAPDEECSRAQFLQMMWQVSGKPVEKAKKEVADVPPHAYYYNAVHWAYNHGITSGASPNSFGPNGLITRAQAITMMWRAQNSPKIFSGNDFLDVPLSAYYYYAVQWALAKGITAGTN